MTSIFNSSRVALASWLPARLAVLVALGLALGLVLAGGCVRETSDGSTGVPPAVVAANAEHDSVYDAMHDSSLADSAARARQDSINRTVPGYVVDSILPIVETMRRFRARVGGEPVTTLEHGSPSRDALVQRFVRAVAAGDSSELRAMLVNAREFIDLVYPESPNTRPPYQQDPALVWRTIQNPSESGFKRLIRRTGGSNLRLAGYTCDLTPGRQGKNVFWSSCILQLVKEKGDTSTHRFFGSILARDGRFKFMSYKNEF